ncbi:MAG TPA: type II toxin-antitoxin system ParD family antitoxin [Cyanobacteria bacterium UBA8803]|nr:type II toxin-antitoxin system ParD family antitoxin [Cyanobacteria bacterium UBA9273]HBL57982.1 type II toxin-antitoxin system ParD family antitoxin [Cyanobacteria bacterium UBA8803]
MTTLNISLPESIQAFIEQQVVKGGYQTVNDYILHLIRQEQAKIARVESLLLDELDSGELMEVTDEWWEKKRAQLVQGFEDTQE